MHLAVIVLAALAVAGMLAFLGAVLPGAAVAQTSPTGTPGASCIVNGDYHNADVASGTVDTPTAQTFTPTEDGQLTNVQMYIKTFSTEGDFILELLKVDPETSIPLKSALASATVPASEVDQGVNTTITANFADDPMARFEPGKQYALSIRNSSQNYSILAINAFTVGYPEGNPCPDGAAYQAPDGQEFKVIPGTDLLFATYTTASLEISDLQLNDIDNQPLRFLSTDDHDYFDSDEIPDNTLDGNTRIHGTMTISGGEPGDKLEKLDLEISWGETVETVPMDPALLGLVPAFGEDGQVSIDKSQLLYRLPSAQAARFEFPVLTSTDSEGDVELKVKASTQKGHEAEKSFGMVPRLVGYKGTNRYDSAVPPRDPKLGGDDWVRPAIRPRIARIGPLNPGTLFGDFSNMNGGTFSPHASHQEGKDVDVDAPWYDARDTTTADNLLKILNSGDGVLNSGDGASIEKIYVTFNPLTKPPTQLANCEPVKGKTKRDTDHSAFYKRIQNKQVPAAGGSTRSAADVIVPAGQHCRHFHIQFFEP
jgi:hypothetical protein